MVKNNNNIAFLLVTCCLEESRTKILADVIDNLVEQAPSLKTELVVFDNASNQTGIVNKLCNTFDNVFQASKNVGYWSAIDWWVNVYLPSLTFQPEYTYIIESDMMHYAFHKIYHAEHILNSNHDIGSVRLHEYSVENKHLYNKDVPRKDSIITRWQSHHNKVTQKPIEFEILTNGFWKTTFLTQLPALNRYSTLKKVFSQLNKDKFTEIDFQTLYWNFYQKTAICDGGIYYCNDGGPNSQVVVNGSWTPVALLDKIGYQLTRVANITPNSYYTVQKLSTIKT